MSAYGYSDGSGNARLFAAGAQHVFSDMAELPALIDAGRRCGTV
jgi:phosphoglycolate phosphatase-like HAD superfamily hydrolase